MFKNKKFIIYIAISVFLIFSIVFILKMNTEFTDNAYLKSNIIIIKPNVDGYITEILVDDNQFVKAGQAIAKIDDLEYKFKLNLAQANVDAAIANINGLKEKVKIQNFEINNSNFQKDSAKVSLDVADKELKRAGILIKDGVISQQEVDRKIELQNNLSNKYASASANSLASLLKQEVIILELAQAEALLKMHEANLELALINLDNTVIKAAMDGIVSSRSLQIGQLASPRLALGYIVQEDVWVIANFKETKIGRMKSGQEVVVEVDSIPGVKFKAKIDSLSPATGSEFSILPSENATGNFTKIVQRVPVKIIFDNNQDLSLLRAGLSCEVKVHLSD